MSHTNRYHSWVIPDVTIEILRLGARYAAAVVDLPSQRLVVNRKRRFDAVPLELLGGKLENRILIPPRLSQ